MAWPSTRAGNGPPPVDFTEWNGILTLAARKDAPNAFTSYQDLLALNPADVPTPPAGRRRLFVSTVDNKVYAKTSAGTLVSLEEAGGGGGGGDVSSVFGRTGAVVAIEGDYSLSLLSDVDDVSAPSNGQVLRYNSTSGLWEAGAAVGITAVKHTFTWEDFVAASPDPPNAGSSNFEILRLGQLEKMVGVTAKHSVAFAGSPITTAILTLIWDFTGEAVMPNFDAATAVADDNKMERNTWYSPNHSTTESHRALFVQLNVLGSGSGRISHLTAGSVDIWIATFTLPS